MRVQYRKVLFATCISFILGAQHNLEHIRPHEKHPTSLRAEGTKKNVDFIVAVPETHINTTQHAYPVLLRTALDSVDAVSGEIFSASNLNSVENYIVRALVKREIPLSIDIRSVSIYVAACLAMGSFVIAIIYPLGPVIVCQALIYVSCLAFIKMSMKVVYAFGYNFPKFISAVHLGITSVVAFSVLLYRRQTLGKPLALPDGSEMLFGILPIALAFGLSIAFDNTALLFVSASFAEVLSASTPAASAYMTYVMGMPFPLQLLKPILIVVLGCVISVQGEMNFSCIGCALLLLAVFCRSFKSVLQQKFMTSTAPDKFDPVTLTAWTCCFASALVGMYSFLREGYEPIHALANAPDMFALIAAVLFSCLIASMLNISGLFLVKGLGAVGMQIVGQVKAFLVVIGGLTLLKESFTCVQIFGFSLALVGVFWYSSMHRRILLSEKRHNVGSSGAGAAAKIT